MWSFASFYLLGVGVFGVLLTASRYLGAKSRDYKREGKRTSGLVILVLSLLSWIGIAIFFTLIALYCFKRLDELKGDD